MTKINLRELVAASQPTDHPASTAGFYNNTLKMKQMGLKYRCNLNTRIKSIEKNVEFFLLLNFIFRYLK